MYVKSFIAIVFILSVINFMNAFLLVSLFNGWKKASCFALGIGPIGAIIYPTGRLIMLQRAQNRNITGEALSIEYKQALRCHYNPEMLEKIRIYWGIPPLDTWSFSEKMFLSGNIIAMTFGYDIFIKADKMPGFQQLALIRHECMHTKQYENDGSFLAFGFNYFTQWCTGGFSYEKIQYEIDAFATASWLICK